ncbi:MAG: trypsin-like peptidase domain-containing protein [Proteobacteria bacterium]|nr:trypsin-like peptidase domain-containing protein [Pseudomonadota bacterium]MBI3499852.1 trypsin-like peptidase domain-containing protein [Pseudomonadota bacterium]
MLLARLLIIAVGLLACAAAVSSDASAQGLHPTVKEAVDKAQAAAKIAQDALKLGSKASAEAVTAATTALSRANDARALPPSSLVTLTSKEGNRLQGQAREGKINGPCILQATDGTRYEGECRDNAITGYGIEVLPSGFRYEGAFERGKRHGMGRSTYPDGSRYEGAWVSEVRTGYGAIISAVGDLYVGQVAGGKANGHGGRKLQSGLSYTGEWREGRAEGYGVLTLANGDSYQGQLRQGKYSGPGVYASRAEGKAVQGLWENGTLKQELGPAIASAPPGSSSSPQPKAPAKKAAPPQVATGTGFFVTKAGHIVTNHHVAGACRSLQVHAVGEAPVGARLVATSPREDLALLKVSEPGEAVSVIRAGPALRPGDGVVVFGFPLPGLVTTSGNLTTGNVSALAGLADSTGFFQISAPVQPGNSGGPLLDMSGNVIGVIVSKLDAAKVASVIGDIPQNVNFAIKASVLTSFLEAHDIRYETAPSSATLSVADVGERARSFTVMVECYK